MKEPMFWVCVTSLAMAELCLFGYSLGGFSAKVVVVLFWSGAVSSLVAVSATRWHRLVPLGAAVLSWLLLLPVAESAAAWSTWWMNGFGP